MIENADKQSLIDPQADTLNAIDGFDYDRPANSNNIRTWSGKYVDPLNMTADDIDINDIAHALSHICRYGGHVRRFYSVAEHSVMVASQARRTYGSSPLTLSALLHDSAEAYLGDIPRPLKRLEAFRPYQYAEEQVEAAIEEHFGLTVPLNDPRIKNIDGAVIPWEMAGPRDMNLDNVPDMSKMADAYVANVLALLQEIEEL